MPDAISSCGRSLALVAALGIFAAGCSKGDGNNAAGAQDSSYATTSEPSLAREIQPILNDNCVACHQTGSAQGGLVLEGSKSFANIVGVKSQESSLEYVDPGKPDRSYLMLKLIGRHQEVGGTGAAMPLGDSLTPAQITLIRKWILAGAPDN